MTRCFVFGCSLTDWLWATCADLVGSNFDKYYNLGKAGASNGFIMNRVFEADKVFNFSPATDLVLIGATGIGRFSFYKEGWNTHGDMLSPPGYNQHPEAINIFNPSWALYNTYISLISIKEYLTAKKIKHIIYPGIDINDWATGWGINDEDSTRIADIQSVLDVKTSLYGYVSNLRSMNTTKPITFQDSETELHPTPLEHYMYLQSHLRDFDTVKTNSVFNALEQEFDNSSKKNQSGKFLHTPILSNRVSVCHNSLFISKTQYV
jgi:hypothetical protein